MILILNDFSSFIYQGLISLSKAAVTLPLAKTSTDVNWALLWARVKVVWTSLFVADVEKTLNRRHVRVGRTNYVLRTKERRRVVRKTSFGPNVGRPLYVTSECDVLWSTLTEWAEAKEAAFYAKYGGADRTSRPVPKRRPQHIPGDFKVDKNDFKLGGSFVDDN